MLIQSRKIIFLLLILLFSKSSYAAYSCASINDIAGRYSGAYGGSILILPGSSFAYVAINNAGQIAVGEYINVFGIAVGIFSFSTGTISIVNNAQCLTVANIEGTIAVIKFANGGNSAVMSFPFDPNLFMSGSFAKD